ncbi:LysR substrate-binding domain-containing protein [Vibrio sonorensis]|uniref:LysR substrate-binding domain-containing protein n=1 Tax=Vibrio sonorensis TaxID=1004316 RepID=UPI0008D8F0BA|nr:LysR substrate-binding domain-containing protein [Vibrio sonorensis]
MNPPLKSLYAFVAVAETGLMTEAATRLNVSHSAVSQAIKSLENQLGQALFQRVGRNVILNASGQRYYQQVAPALEQITNATKSLVEEQHSHRLTLNMVNSLAMHWWIPEMQRFNDFAPKLDIRISNLVGRFKMEKEGVDVAIVHGKTTEWQDYYCEKLADDELILVCSPEHAVVSSDPTELIEKYPLIEVVNDRRKHDLKVWCDAKKLTPPETANNLTFLASFQAVQATIRQLGVFVTHRLYVKKEIDQGLLVEVGSPVLNPYQDFYFACLPQKLKNKHVVTLRDWVRSEFGKLVENR